MENHTLRGTVCTLLGGIGWGFSGACGQYLLQRSNIPSLQITLIRMFFAGIILVLINIAKNKKAAFDILKSKKIFCICFYLQYSGL